MIERRGIRQDLDSWRYKLIQCVGFESILEGLFGSRLIEDLRLFKDCQPEGVSDWSFDENCLFCCLRREKVKEHLLGLNNDSLGSVARPLSFIKDQFNISSLEREAEEFLNAVLHRKDIPSFSDPDIPVVAREIMQRMIRQFAAEYTSKTSSAQGTPQPNDTLDQSLLTTHSHTPAPAATAPAALTSARNPVLSQLLMAEQDAPLDLTVKKPDVIVCEQDGVLDLSTKKSRNRGTASIRPPAAPLVKGDSHDLGLAYARDLQSTSDLERFMAKLCLHHQRQIVDALGYLETEVKAVASSSVSHVSVRAVPDDQMPMSCGLPLCHESSEIQCSGRTLAHSSKARCKVDLLEPAIQGNSKKVALAKNTYFPESRNVSGSGSLLDLRKDAVEGGNILSSLLIGPHEYQSPHGISSTNSVQQCASDTLVQTSRRDSDVTEVSPSYERHEFSEPLQHSSQSFPGHTKDISSRPSLVLRTSTTVSPNAPRTARKSRRGSFPRTKDGSVCRIDPDSNCDIVYIGKSITECPLETSNRMLPRRNARKSIRGHLYTEEYLELKTVRTLARKSAENGSGNCPAPMPVIPLVTPKPALAKPDGVPSVDMPFAGGCGESVLQTTPSETSGESEMLGDVLTNVNDADLIVETSQTDQTTRQDKVDACPQTVKPVAAQEGSLTKQDEVPCTTEPLSQQSVELPARDDRSEADTELINKSAEHFDPVLEMPKEDPPCDQSPEPLSVLDDECVEEPYVRNESPALTQQDDSNSKDKETNVELKDQNVDISADVEEQFEASALAKQVLDDNTQTDVLNAQAGIETEMNLVPNSCEMEEKVVVDEPTSEYTCSDTPPETYLEKEEVVREVLSSPESKKQKKRRNVRTFGSSDRRLRSRASGVQEISMTPEKNDQPALAQVFDSVPEEPKSPETKRPLRSIKAKPLESDVSNSEAQHNAGVYEEQTQLSSTDKLDKTADSNPCENPVADHVVQTRKMLRSMQARQTLDQEGEQKAVSLVSNVTDALISTPKELKNKKTPVESEKSETDKSASDKSEESRLEDSHVPDPPSKDNLMEPLSPQSVPSPVTNSRVSGRMPLRSRTGPVDGGKHQPMEKSLSEKSGYMPLRSAGTSVAEDTPGDSSSTATDSVEEKSRYMPLRSRSHVVDSDASSSTGNHSENAGRMPLRSSSSNTAIQAMSPMTSAKDKKVQRSPRLFKSAVISSDTEQSLTGSPPKSRAEKVMRGPIKQPVMPFILPSISNSESIAPGSSKFLHALRKEENQHLIMNLNAKFDKMQKGWVQMDKEGPQTQRSRNKADRLKDIWKSKRRIRKPRPLEPHKFSPVQMLFMKSFDLPSICRWFLQSTETKSLVIVKKVNTRLPSETQLCFHSSSSMAGTSHDVFPSVQAERWKKHLKKFPIAFPVKSNAKSQKLIAEALEQEPTNMKAKEKRQLTTATRMSTKPQSYRGVAQPTECQKTSGVVKNPASARILRKYSNIREKMQGQQKSRKLKDHKTEHRKGPSKQKLSSANQQKLALSRRSSGKDTNISKNAKAQQSLSNKKSATRTSGKERAAKTTSSKALKEPADKDGPTTKRFQQTQTSPKPQRTTTATPLSPKANTNKKENAAEKNGGEKSQTNDAKAETRKPVPTKVLVSPAQSPEPSATVSQDQVLTRSQRKMETAQRPSESPKSAVKRAQDPVVASPVKRTRTSVSKTN